MNWIVISLITCFVFLLTYLISIKKEIKNITNQLNDYNNLKSGKKIDVKLFDKDIEKLASSINKHIDINIENVAKERQAEDEIKRSIANISHDLRTPLTSVVGYIQMIKSKKLSKEKESEYIDIALNRAKALKTLLSDFFQLSVIESPEYELKIEHVNLNNILCEVITSFYEDFVHKNITPEINLPEKGLIVIGNESAVRRVIENLIVNIIKHTEGEVSITLKEDKNEAVIITKNTVKNFTNNDVDLMFNRFYKADDSRTNSSNTGLGLPIAKSLMEKMNAVIYARLHENTLFIFCKWTIK
ncbi:HAMP domain-containing histidine kinase [Clostridium sp. P21]|uniref:histidine kinase n=1 Tax=Clostridium muellerianum TaxID=2716538 RepID=A0A7Y0EGA8_9CLOT|nr:HAMP domain-containing sensor histidine kinase [Clostridium muellerianum]NMM62966.1 HAMP domain-containing histidine kinase [Clostridium muellerianum]